MSAGYDPNERFPGEYIRLRWTEEAVKSLGVDPFLSSLLTNWVYLRNPIQFSPLT